MTPGRVRRLMRERGAADADELREHIRLLETILELEKKVDEVWSNDDELEEHLRLLSAVEEAEKQEETNDAN
jgi:hypothetical protein